MEGEEAFPRERGEETSFQAEVTADAKSPWWEKVWQIQVTEGGLLAGTDGGGMLSEAARVVGAREF